MIRMYIERLDAVQKSVAPVPGRSTTLQIPGPPEDLNSLQDLLTWLIENPQVISMILAAILSIFARAAEAPKTA